MCRKHAGPSLACQVHVTGLQMQWEGARAGPESQGASPCPRPSPQCDLILPSPGQFPLRKVRGRASRCLRSHGAHRSWDVGVRTPEHRRVLKEGNTKCLGTPGGGGGLHQVGQQELPGTPVSSLPMGQGQLWLPQKVPANPRPSFGPSHPRQGLFADSCVSGWLGLPWAPL